MKILRFGSRHPRPRIGRRVLCNRPERVLITMAEPSDPLHLDVMTHCEKCCAEINIRADLSRVFATFYILTQPYRSFMEDLHTSGRIADEELMRIDETVQKLRSSMKFGYKQLPEEDAPGPSIGHHTS